VFFVASKVLGLFVLPSNLIVTLGLVGLLLMVTRFRQSGRRLTVAAFILFAVASLSPFGNVLMVPLEERFPPWNAALQARQGPPDGIIVLGGAIDPETVITRGTPDINEAAERVAVIPELARRYPQARIIYSGGNAHLGAKGGSEAEYAAALLESFGVPKDRLTLEDQSRNTAENAAYCIRLAAPKPGERWLLVTSAYHMPRAMGAFRKAGFEIEAYPVDYRTAGTGDLFAPFVDATAGLRRTDTAAREWIGLLVYWLTGRSAELFPGPRPGRPA
jgi:uncharacterized SAM-binding protein YcdF (DUF218 family)